MRLALSSLVLTDYCAPQKCKCYPRTPLLMETPRPPETPALLKLKKRQLVKHSQILGRFIIVGRLVNWTSTSRLQTISVVWAFHPLSSLENRSFFYTGTSRYFWNVSARCIKGLSQNAFHQLGLHAERRGYSGPHSDGILRRKKLKCLYIF